MPHESLMDGVFGDNPESLFGKMFGISQQAQKRLKKESKKADKRVAKEIRISLSKFHLGKIISGDLVKFKTSDGQMITIKALA